jgi:hypothetical protein
VTGNPATGSFYSVLTFLLLAGAFLGGTHLAMGWDFPSENRLVTSVTLLYLVAAGAYAMFVGRHRDVEYPEALRRGAIDVGRKLKGMVLR